MIGVSGGLDSTHALIVAAAAMDREGRPRSDILAFTLPGFATGDRTKGNAMRAGEALGRHLRPSSTSGDRAADARATWSTRSRAARRSTTSRSRTCRPGCAPTTCSGWPTSAAASCWAPVTCPSWRWAGRTYGVGDQMSHYNVNGGVPKTLIQHLIRWVDRRRSSSPTRSTRFCCRCWTPRSPRSWCPTERRTRSSQSTEETVGPYALQDFSLFYVLRYGFRPSKIAFLAWHAWSDAERGDWPPGFPPDERPAYDLAEIRQWLEVFAQRFFAFSQFKRSAMPNGPKVSARRLAVPARRLARAVGHVGQDLAGRDRAGSPRGLSRR